jgi:hypothetical protein
MIINKIIIGGEYWDSYIYSNGLILFTRDHRVESYKWDQIVNTLLDDKTIDELALKCAFLNSEYLYGFCEKALFDDFEFKEVLFNKFQRNSRDLFLNLADLQSFRSYKKPLEIPELPSDLGVYRNVLYYCNSDGVFSRNLRKNNDNLVSSKVNEHIDCPVQCLKVGNSGRIALSASSDGLMELDVKSFYGENWGFKPVGDDIVQISTEHSSYCNWSFSSVLSGSYSETANLFGFNYETVKPDLDDYFTTEYKKLKFLEKYNEREMFNEEDAIGSSLVFSGNEKIYRISNGKVDVLNFTQKNINSQSSPFSLLYSNMLDIQGEIVCAEVAEFGIVIETKNSLYVISSSGEMQVVNNSSEDKIVNWRVFPRSTSYVNQLHVIYEDRLEVLSINDDYFVDPKSKIFGQRFKNRLRWF